MKAKIRIIVDWTSEESIKKAEAKKLKLENKGYSLFMTLGGSKKSILIYTI